MTIPDTPMMKQYYEIKKEYPDAILFFRMGDFYEMFFEDARIASDVLQIVLTERQKGVPMAGIPYHSLENYLHRFVNQGYKIAICEQLENKPEKGNKIVRREITRIVTPGTDIHEDKLSNYLISIYLERSHYDVIVCDFTSGESLLFHNQSFRSEQIREIQSLVMPYRQAEFLIAGNSEINALINEVKQYGGFVNRLEDWVYDSSYAERMIADSFQILSIEKLWGDNSAAKKENFSGAILALGALLHYGAETQKRKISHLRPPRYVRSGEFLRLDENAVRSLELIENEREGGRSGTLLAILDLCQTPMGKRRLKQALLYPLTKIDIIEKRQNRVVFWLEHEDLRQKTRELLQPMCDLERVTSKIATNRATPADLGMLRAGLVQARFLLEFYALTEKEVDVNVGLDFAGWKTETALQPLLWLSQLSEKMTIDLSERLTINFNGQIFQPHYHPEIGRLRMIAAGGKEWIFSYQEKERTRTNISTLRVKYNKVFGYFIEISKGQSSQAPEDYERKQTLVNAERFTTKELKEFERDILEADERLSQLEKTLFDEYIAYLLTQIEPIQWLAHFIADLDFIVSLAEKAHQGKYVRPRLSDSVLLRIIEGRHPVVEEFLAVGEFVGNDLLLDGDARNMAIITGPNMAGKSTFIRQNALLVLLAQMGSFVPAKEAVIGLCDQIFTRIGSGDNLARGQSTFLLEMQETAAILHNYTERSLLILDEVGRGTSTYDGMSIAWSILEYLSRNQNMPRTLFATHYHELTELANRNGVFNLFLAVEEQNGTIQFLRRVLEGVADRSYGVHVAQLAGLPSPVIRRAYQILSHLETNNDDAEPSLFSTIPKEILTQSVDENQVPSYPPLHRRAEWVAEHPIMQELSQINLAECTPLEALSLLHSWQKMYNEKQ